MIQMCSLDERALLGPLIVPKHVVLIVVATEEDVEFVEHPLLHLLVAVIEDCRGAMTLQSLQ